MSSRVPIDYIDMRVFAHATEDLGKVMTAVRNTIPLELIDNVAFKQSSLTGYHGNPIILIEARIKEKEVVQPTFEKLSAGLSILDKEQLCNRIDQHLESGNLYLRLDKQSAYLGELRLGVTDSIHLRIHFKKHGKEEVVEICRGFGLLP